LEMLPVLESDGKRTNRQIIWHSLLLIPVSVVPSYIGILGISYFWGALILSVAYFISGFPLVKNYSLENAKLLSKHFISFSKFKNLSKQTDYEDLLNIDGIGETQANSIKSFFSNKTNLKVLNELEKVLVVKNATQNSDDGLLKNKTFLVTGKLNGISRAEVKSLIEENSGKTISSVSKKLNFLIIGEKPTKKKVDYAKHLKIKVIDQAEFLKMLNKTS